jgi:hypothetical protein
MDVPAPEEHRLCRWALRRQGELVALRAAATAVLPDPAQGGAHRRSPAVGIAAMSVPRVPGVQAVR